MENEEIELTEEELLSAIEVSGLSKPFQAYIQKIGDKRMSEGLKTYQANQNKKNLSDSERIVNLEKEITELKNGISKSSLNNSIKASLKEAGLSEGFAQYIKVDSNNPSEIVKSVAELKDNLTKIEQDKIDLKLKQGGIPPKGQSGTGGNSTLENYIESKNKGQINSPFQGKLEAK